MTQNKLNSAVSSCLEELADAMKIASKSRDILMELLVFEGNRIDSLHDKMDILMTERAENKIDKTHYKQPLTEEESFFANEDVFDTKTEYVTSSTANADNVNKAKSIFEDAVDEYLDDLIQTQITPNALITLGFKEEYQHSIDGIAGFLYYTLTLNTVEFCSTSLGEDEPLYVMLGHEGQFSIHNLRKLGDLILSLNEL
tara:strand:- start:445 stop:1041 length:597 start_codon:yes stop_codon:yes gene_type:complete